MYPTLLSPLVGLLGVLVTFVVLPGIAAVFICHREGIDGHSVVTNSPVMGVVQNGFSALVLLALLGTLMIELASAASGIFAFFRVFVLFALKITHVFFPLSMNVKHLRAVLDDIGDEALVRLRPLSRHLQRQAVVVATAFIPWALVYLLLSRLMDGKAFRAKLWNRLLLRDSLRDALFLFVEFVPGELPKDMVEKLDVLSDGGFNAVRVEDDNELSLLGYLWNRARDMLGFGNRPD